MKIFSPLTFVTAIVVIVGLGMVCLAAGIPLDWGTRAVLAAVGFSAGCTVDRLYNRNRGAEIVERVKGRQTEAFLAGLERGSDQIPWAGMR